MENTNTIAVLWGTWARYEDRRPGTTFYMRADEVENTGEVFPIAAIIMDSELNDEVDTADFDRVDYPSDWKEGYAVLEVFQCTVEVPSNIQSFNLVSVGPGTTIQVYDEMFDSFDFEPMDMDEVIDLETGKALDYGELF